jgi:hypothetical protein
MSEVCLPLAAINVDPAIQQRAAGTSQEVVEEYSHAMLGGDEFSLPGVFSIDGLTYYLGNRFHRLDAYRLAYSDAHEIAREVRPRAGPSLNTKRACWATDGRSSNRADADRSVAASKLYAPTVQGAAGCSL